MEQGVTFQSDYSALELSLPKESVESLSAERIVGTLVGIVATGYQNYLSGTDG